MKNIISFFPKEDISEALDLFKKSRNISFSGSGNSSSKAMILSSALRNEALNVGNVLWVVNDINDMNVIAQAAKMWTDREVFVYKKRDDSERLTYPTTSDFERVKRVELTEFVARIFLLLMR
jgi:hypothetical protein